MEVMGWWKVILPIMLLVAPSFSSFPGNNSHQQRNLQSFGNNARPSQSRNHSLWKNVTMKLYNETNINQQLLLHDRELLNHINSAGFLHVVAKAPSHAFTSFKIHSARSGDANRLDGIGSKCDWAITWNGALYGVTAIPRIVCIGTRQIEKFWKLVPHLTRSRFVFVTVGGDRLQPLGNSQYLPYNGFGAPDGGPGWREFTQSPNILHVFSENHNMNHSRYSTLPCGFPHSPGINPAMLLRDIEKSLQPHIPLEKRPVRVLVSDRIRSGPWYQDRVLAREYCLKVSSSFCSTKYDKDIPGNSTVGQNGHFKFVWSVQNSQFVLCTHGGGLDPSPKAWESILIGSIPIIEHSTLDDGYIRLPVAIVPNITEFLLNADGKSPMLLDMWMEELKPHYEVGSVLRQQALHRLTHDYWFNVIKEKYDEVARKINEAVSKGKDPIY